MDFKLVQCFQAIFLDFIIKDNEHVNNVRITENVEFIIGFVVLIWLENKVLTNGNA